MKKAVAAGMIALFASSGLVATGTSASAAPVAAHGIVANTHRDWNECNGYGYGYDWDNGWCHDRYWGHHYWGGWGGWGHHWHHGWDHGDNW